MLGFDALGTLALGQVPGATVLSVSLNATVAAMAQVRSSGTQTFALQAKIDTSAFLKVQMSPASALSAKVSAKLSAKAPGGVILKSIVNGQAKANVSPGYLLFARVMMSSSSLSDIHIEGKTSSPRDPLLLNSGSQFGASYWKGRS
jgi:hypothetical protein